MAGIDVVDDIHINIGENNMVPGLLHQHSDKASADLSGADHYCFFHFSPFPMICL